MKKNRGVSRELRYIYAFAILMAVVIVYSIIEFIIKYIIYILAIGTIIFSVIIIVKYIHSKDDKKKDASQKEISLKIHQETHEENDSSGEEQNKTYIPNIPNEQEVSYKFAEDLPAQNVNYRKKPLLTDHERKFYYSLAPIAKKYDLCVLSKIRIADLVEPTAHEYKERSDYFHHFGKIKAKHIDFALCDPENMEVKLLIELDDRTHETAKGRERDEFVEEVYKDTGYRLLRVYNTWSLETKIREVLGITEEYKIKTP